MYFQVDTIQGTSSTNNMAAEIHALREEINALKIQNASPKTNYLYTNTHIKQRKPNSQRKCYNCGNPYPHAKEFPARNQICHICGKRNHFAKVCRSTRITPGQRRPLNRLTTRSICGYPSYARGQYRYTVALLR